MIPATLAVRQALPADQARLANMLYFEHRVHRHLDWRPPLDWLGVPEFWVTEQNNLVTAALACPPDPPGIYWIRLFMAAGYVPLDEAWSSLWQAAREQITAQGGGTVAALLVSGDFAPLLRASGFVHSDTIVTLENQLHNIPAVRPLPAGYHLRPMQGQDLQAVAALDAEAFGHLWHNTAESLQHAATHASFVDVVLSDGQVVGYQLSTDAHLGTHLARLAVHPQHQKRGLGYALVQGMLQASRNAGKHRITVNTQGRNEASLHLYRQLGFSPTGENYPLYTIDISP